MANDIAIDMHLNNQRYMQQMAASKQSMQTFSKTMEHSRGSFQQFESNMKRSSGSMRINTNVMQNAIYMVEDMSSVYGTSGLAGAIRAGSNNLTMMASAFGPWGMAAAVAVSSATQLYLAFNKGADSAKASSDAVKKYGEQLSKVMDIEARRVEFQHSLRDADSAAGASRLLQSEKDTLDTIQAQIAKSKELEQTRQQNLQTLQERKKVLEARSARDIGPMGPGIGQIDDGARASAAKELAAIEKQIADNKAQQTGNQNRLNDLIVQQAAQEERIAKARKNAMEMAKTENARLQEQKRAMLSKREAEQRRERAQKEELENERAIAAAVQVAANAKKSMQSNASVRSNRQFAQSAGRGSRDFAMAFAGGGGDMSGLSPREQRAMQIMKDKQKRLEGPFRDTFSGRREQEINAVKAQQRKLKDNANAKSDPQQKESQAIKKAVDAGAKATNEILAQQLELMQKSALAPQMNVTVGAFGE